MLLNGSGGEFVNKDNAAHDEQKRQFGELSVEFSENLERGAHANLEALADQWLALEVKVGRVVCNDEVLSWFTGPRFEQPVTLR